MVAVDTAVRVWLAPYFGTCDISQITVEDVERLIEAMEEGRKPGPRQRADRRYGRPCGPKSIRNYVGILSALLDFAMRPARRGEPPPLKANPVRLIDLPPVPEAEVRFLDQIEVEALIEAADDQLDRALYVTAILTGLRMGELQGLRWGDCDWGASKVRVRQNYVLGKFGAPKSRRGTRAVPMGKRVARELNELHKAQGEPDDDALVFADPKTGVPFGKTMLRRRFKAAMERAGLDPSHRFHDLRHTYGTRMAANPRVAMRQLQEFMGHASIQTTERYADYAPAPHEADLVDEAFAVDDPRVPVEDRASVVSVEVS